MPGCMYKYSKFQYKNVKLHSLQKSNTYYIEIRPLFIVLYENISIILFHYTFSNFVINTNLRNTFSKNYYNGKYHYIMTYIDSLHKKKENL